jgi:hypothetical protein
VVSNQYGESSLSFLVKPLHDDPVRKDQLPNRFIVDVFWSVLKSPFLNVELSSAYDGGLDHFDGFGDVEITSNKETV